MGKKYHENNARARRQNRRKRKKGQGKRKDECSCSVFLSMFHKIMGNFEKNAGQ
jgi:hypothetical protein